MTLEEFDERFDSNDECRLCHELASRCECVAEHWVDEETKSDPEKEAP